MAQFEYGDQVLQVDDATFHVLIGLTNRLYDSEACLGELSTAGLLAPAPDDAEATREAKQKARGLLAQARSRQR